jgi:EpsI family protein
MIARALMVLGLIAAAGAYAAGPRAETTAERTPLYELPHSIGSWSGSDTEPFADDIVAQLGVDDYINRLYFQPGHQAPVAVYVGYYGSQRHGDTIHSPQNCLPGAGWRPVESGRHQLSAGGRTVEVNRYVISKGASRQVVLYWYQGRGRVVAGEYTNKALLMLDAARLGRSSGGLVRLITPVTADTDAATAQLTAFASQLLPHLSRHLP